MVTLHLYQLSFWGPSASLSCNFFAHQQESQEAGDDVRRFEIAGPLEATSSLGEMVASRLASLNSKNRAR